MYRYWQAGEKSTWQVIKDDPEVEQRALEEGARKLTILAVSEIITSETSRQTLKYKGDLYFDIDCAGNLMLAIASTIALVMKLLELGVPTWAIRVYASGSKGFHVIVKAECFSSGRALADLPAIYKEMALELYVLGIDFQVYSGGRGVCWRIENLQRDNGRYRVPITIEELRDMTPEKYVEVTSHPRIIPVEVGSVDTKAVGLEAMFERCKKKVRDKPKAPEPIPDESLSIFRETPPACVTELADYKVKPSRNFNEVAFQMAIFVARSGMEEALSGSLLSRMASNSDSGAYPSPQDRDNHLQGLVKYMNVTQEKQFSCNAMRAVLASRPCADCSLCKDGAERLTAGESVGMIAREDGYYLLQANSEKRISTFVLDPVDVFLDVGQSGTESRRLGTEMNIFSNGTRLGSVMFDEAGWGSKSVFKNELKGISHLAFYGSDDDVQRIKHITMSEEEEMGEIVQVHRAGIHLQKVADTKVRVYVEPGLSVNQYKVRGTHKLADTVLAPPNVHTCDLPALGDADTAETLRQLMKMNDPAVMAQILGWHAACHLKAHIMDRYSQFPLLSLWGNAGAGKTMTAGLMCWLNGCNYNHDDAAISVASITTYALLFYCGSTTTVPRILEEYNKSKMPASHYSKWGEFMKMSWNQQAVARGALRKSNVNGKGAGAEVRQMPISSPLIIIGEQAPSMPALAQRTVMVHLDPMGRNPSAFAHAQKYREHLRSMAKAMVITALQTGNDWMIEHMEMAEARMPDDLTDRPRFAYQTLLLGLMFYKQVTSNLKLGLEKEVSDMEEALVGMLSSKVSQIQRAKQTTEVDLVMKDIGLMVQITLNDTKPWLVVNKHYKISHERLFMDLPVLFSTYKQFKAYCREPLVIESDDLFNQLIRNEPYFVTDRSITGASALHLNRSVLELDMRKMAEKGLDVSMYG